MKTFQTLKTWNVTLFYLCRCISHLDLTDLHNNHYEPNDARKFGKNQYSYIVEQWFSLCACLALVFEMFTANINPSSRKVKTRQLLRIKHPNTKNMWYKETFMRLASNHLRWIKNFFTVRNSVVIWDVGLKRWNSKPISHSKNDKVLQTFQPSCAR